MKRKHIKTISLPNIGEYSVACEIWLHPPTFWAEGGLPPIDTWYYHFSTVAFTSTSDLSIKKVLTRHEIKDANINLPRRIIEDMWQHLSRVIYTAWREENNDHFELK